MDRSELYALAWVGLGLGSTGVCWGITWIFGDIVRRRK